MRGAVRDGWTCASRLENGLADGFFDFKVAEDGHTKIALDFAPDCDVRDIGRLALQVVEIETYRSFAAIGLNRARAAQAQLSDVAARVPTSISAAGSADSERFDLLSQLTGELEEVWRRTSFRFAACTAYWDLVTARLASLQEQAFDSRITIGGFLERRLQPAIATYQSTERRRHDLAEQIAAMTGLLQTRIELDMQQQNADLLASLNHAAERQLRLQHTVEGVSTVAISYYLVNLLRAPADWVLAASQRSTRSCAQSRLGGHHRAAGLAQHQAAFARHGRRQKIRLMVWSVLERAMRLRFLRPQRLARLCSTIEMGPSYARFVRTDCVMHHH